MAPDPDSPEVVYERMRWNTPLSEDHANLLLGLLDEVPGHEVLDLGCGWGELLLRAVARTSEGRGTGVDNAAWALERGRRSAAQRGLSQRTEFVDGDASMWTDSCDRILCIGASHAWGGTAEALKDLIPVVRPGGRLVFGDGYWQQSPTTAATALFGEGILSLGDLLEEAISAGWRVLHMSTAGQHEWDDFESSWRAGGECWLQSNPLDHRADEVAARLDGRLLEYATVYRGILGFAYLVLARSNNARIQQTG